MHKQSQKKFYKTPKLTEMGRIHAMTQATSPMGTSDNAATGHMNS